MVIPLSLVVKRMCILSAYYFLNSRAFFIWVATRSEITAECYINCVLGIRSFQKPASSFLRSFDISFFARNMQQYGTTGSTWFLDPLISQYTSALYSMKYISNTLVRPLKIDFLFSWPNKIWQAGGKFHYSIMLTTRFTHNLTQLQMLCLCLFTRLHGRQNMFNNYFMVSSRQQHTVHITFHSCLIRIRKNNHVIVRIRK